MTKFVDLIDMEWGTLRVRQPPPGGVATASDFQLVLFGSVPDSDSAVRRGIVVAGPDFPVVLCGLALTTAFSSDLLSEVTQAIQRHSRLRSDGVGEQRNETPQQSSHPSSPAPSEHLPWPGEDLAGEDLPDTTGEDLADNAHKDLDFDAGESS